MEIAVTCSRTRSSRSPRALPEALRDRPPSGAENRTRSWSSSGRTSSHRSTWNRSRQRATLPDPRSLPLPSRCPKRTRWTCQNPRRRLKAVKRYAFYSTFLTKKAKNKNSICSKCPTLKVPRKRWPPRFDASSINKAKIIIIQKQSFSLSCFSYAANNFSNEILVE